MLGRDDDYRERAWSVPITPTWTPATRRAPCAAPSGSATTSCSAARPAPATGMVRSRAAAARTRGSVTASSAGYLLIPVFLEHMFSGDYEAAYATAAEAAAIGERFGDRDLVAIARIEQGHALVRQGRVGGGPPAGGRDHGGRHRRGAIADRHRHRLLQHDRVLPRRVRAAPRPRVDRRADAVVRAAARHGRPPGPVPGASRRDHDAGRRVAGRAGGGAPSRRAFHAGRLESSGLSARPPTGRRRSIACRASSGSRGGLPGSEPARAGTAAGAGPVAAGARRPRRRGRRDPPGAGRDDRRGSSVRRCCPPTSRSCSPSPTSRRRAGACRELEEIARAPRERRAGGDGRPRPGSGRRWPRATPAPPCSRCAAPGRCGRSSRRRTRPPAPCAGGVGLPRAGTTKTRPHWSSRQPAASSHQLGAAPDLARVDTLAAPTARGRRPRAHAAGAAGAAPGRRRDEQPRRSPPSWSSASGRWTATSRTSSRKLGLSSRAAATAYAYEHDLI